MLLDFLLFADMSSCYPMVNQKVASFLSWYCTGIWQDEFEVEQLVLVCLVWHSSD